MKWMKMLSVVVAVIVGVFAAFGLYLYYAQDRMVFYPTHDLEVTPDQAGLVFEDCRIPVDTGAFVHAWYFPIESDSLSPVVLFCHGNGGNMSHRLETAQFLHEFGVAVLMFDYRGYGKSDGRPSENNLYRDADVCYDWLQAEKRFKPDRIVLFGRSLGGAVAIDITARKPCRGLIVESSFTSIAAMGKRMFPILPVGLLLKYRFDSIEKIARVTCPKLLTHSPDDEVIPYEMGRALYDRAVEPKTWVDLEGGHNGRDYLKREDYRKAIESILWNGGEKVQ